MVLKHQTQRGEGMKSTATPRPWSPTLALILAALAMAATVLFTNPPTTTATGNTEPPHGPPGRACVELHDDTGGLSARKPLANDPPDWDAGPGVENFGRPMDEPLILGQGLTMHLQKTAITILRRIRLLPRCLSEIQAPIPEQAVTATSNTTVKPSSTPATPGNELPAHAPETPLLEDNANNAAHCPNRKAQVAYHLLLSRYPALAEIEPPCLWEPKPRYPRDNSANRP